MANGNGKCLEQIKLAVPEDLKRQLQDAAMQEDRSVSEFIKVQLIRVLYLRRCGFRLELHGETVAELAQNGMDSGSLSGTHEDSEGA